MGRDSDPEENKAGRFIEILSRLRFILSKLKTTRKRTDAFVNIGIAIQ